MRGGRARAFSCHRSRKATGRASALCLVLTLGTPACHRPDRTHAADAGPASSNVTISDGAVTPPPRRATIAPPIDDSAPPTTGDELTLRMRHLLEAIAQDNPELASDILFPRDAFVGLKDVGDPAEAWRKKVLIPFQRDVARAHKRTTGAARAKFIGFELGGGAIELAPKKKDFKKPLWRVKHSTLTFAVDGKVSTLAIAEMTSWRGAWYVTRLR